MQSATTAGSQVRGLGRLSGKATTLFVMSTSTAIAFLVQGAVFYMFLALLCTCLSILILSS